MSEMIREDFDNDKEWKEYKRMNKRFTITAISRDNIIDCFYEDKRLEEVKHLMKCISDGDMKRIAEDLNYLKRKNAGTEWYEDVVKVIPKHLK